MRVCARARHFNTVPVEATRGHRISRSGNYRRPWVLETQVGSFARAKDLASSPFI